MAHLDLPLIDETAIRRSIASETMRVFNERSIFGAYSAFAGIVLGLGVAWAASGPLLAGLWATKLLLLELGILYLGKRCLNALSRGEDATLWNRIQVALTGVVGLAWGMLPWFVGAGHDFYLYLGSIMMLVGVSGVGMVAMSAYTTSSVLFFCGIYLIPVLHALIHPLELAPFIVAGLFVTLVVQVMYSRELRVLVRRDIEQSVRNAALVRQLENLVIHDQLTGAYSRSYLLQQMEQQVSYRGRRGDTACVIMLDLDHFKKVNDSYGHPAGDRVLVHVVQQISALLREGDVLARVGGEEFMVLLPATPLGEAMQIAERLRAAMAEASVTEGEENIHMPASFGVAELRSTESQADWFRRADHALYRAKALGRNRVVLAD